MMRRQRSIRFRVATSHAWLVLGILILYIGLASSVFWWSLTHELYHYAVQNVETAEGLLSFDAGGRLLLKEDYHNHPNTRLVHERLVEIRDFNTGQVLFRNERLGDRSLGGPPFAGEGVNYSPRSYRMEGGTEVLLVSHEHDIDHRTILIRQAIRSRSLNRKAQGVCHDPVPYPTINTSYCRISGLSLCIEDTRASRCDGW